MTKNSDHLPFWNGKAEGKLRLLRLVIAIPAGILLALFMTFTMRIADMSPEQRTAAMERRAAELRAMTPEASDLTAADSRRSFGFFRF